MSTAVLERLQAERDEARDLAITMAEAEDFDPSNPDFTALQERAEQLDGRVDTLVKALQARESAKALDARIIGGVQSRTERSDKETRPAGWGEQFVRSQAFLDYRGRGTSSRVELDLDVLQTRAPHSVAGFDGVLEATKRTIDVPYVINPLLDVVGNVPVSSNAVDIITYEWANNADIVAEGTVKPESELTPTVTPLSLDTIAHWSEMTRQLIEDSGAVRSRIENELRRGIVKKLADEVGDVVLNGTYPGVQSDESLIHAAREAVGVVQLAGYIPNAVLLNPADWAKMDVETFYVNGNVAIGTTFWGMRAIAVADVPEGNLYVGDFQTAVELYRRNAVGLYVTDSHSSNFTSNIFTLLAETRGKAAVVRPDAVCHANYTPPAPPETSKSKAAS